MKPTENYSNDQLFNLYKDIELVGGVKRMLHIASMSFPRNWEIPKKLRETFSEYNESQNLKFKEIREQELEFRKWLGHHS
tara:strand:- start:257 stop:496 length:240 start_codon:yes stop_codon:yes gene_type:complete